MSEMTIEKARAIIDSECLECEICPANWIDEEGEDNCQNDDNCERIIAEASRVIIADLEQREKELATGIMTNCENCVTRLEKGEWVCARCPTRKYRDKAAETLRKFGGE